jgi:hypothetical protein
MKRRLLSLLVGGLVTASMGVAHAQEQSLGGIEKALAKPSTGRLVAGSGVTVEQTAQLQEKLRLIGQILQASSADTQVRPNAAEAAKWARESLYGMSLAQVRAVGTPTTFQSLSDAIAKARVMPKGLGSASTDLVFFPFPPCRYIDTRIVGGKITGARGFDFANSGNVYGGVAGCNLSTLSGASENQIAAVSINMTIVDTSTAAAPGFATARPAGATASTALVNWTLSSAGFQLGNAAVITSNQTGPANELEIFTSGAVHAIVDVAGVFAAPTATALDCIRTEAAAQVVIPAGGPGSVLSPLCATGYTLVSGGCYSPTSPGSTRILSSTIGYAGFGNAGKWFCLAENTSGSQQTMNVDTICCRLPGR